jgi:hypothetical protein
MEEVDRQLAQYPDMATPYIKEYWIYAFDRWIKSYQ